MTTTNPIKYPTKERTIIKQVAARMTSFGFSNTTVMESNYPNKPDWGAKAEPQGTLSPTVEVWKIVELVEGGAPVYALVINKGHIPLPAWHVVDFRIGNDIYSA